MAKGGPRCCRSQASTPARPAGEGSVSPRESSGRSCPLVPGSRATPAHASGQADDVASPTRGNDAKLTRSWVGPARTCASSATARAASATITASLSDLRGRAIDRTPVAGNRSHPRSLPPRRGRYLRRLTPRTAPAIDWPPSHRGQLVADHHVGACDAPFAISRGQLVADHHVGACDAPFAISRGQLVADHHVGACDASAPIGPRRAPTSDEWPRNLARIAESTRKPRHDGVQAHEGRAGSRLIASGGAPTRRACRGQVQRSPGRHVGAHPDIAPDVAADVGATSGGRDQPRARCAPGVAARAPPRCAPPARPLIAPARSTSTAVASRRAFTSGPDCGT